MRKNILLVICAVLIFFCIFAFLRTTEAAVITDGNIGSLHWWYDSSVSTLFIEGNGSMPSYSSSTSFPWEYLKYSVKTIVIYDGVTSIGNNAFYHFSALQSVTLADSIISIGENAFRDCTKLKMISFGNNLTEIGSYSFYNCKGLTSVTMPDSVNKIGMNAFQNCSELTSVVLGNGVTTVYTSAFKDCSNLRTLSFPCSLSLYHVFTGCTAISEINVTGGNGTWYKNEFSDYPWNISNSSRVHIVVEEGVNTIADNAFKDLTKLYSIELPDSLVEIGYNSFKGCSNLESVSFGNNLRKIGESAFYNSGIRSVILPDTVTEIGNYAFMSCSALTTVVVPCSASINSSTFSNDEIICVVKVTKGSLNWNINGPWLYDSRFNLESVLLEEGIPEIGSYAFSECANLKSITIPDSVTSIKDYAFSLCKGLEEVVIPDSVTSIGEYAFSCCYNIKELTIGEGVSSIKEYAFSGCGSLETIILGSGVRSVGNNAFEKCLFLFDVYYNGTKKMKNQILFGNENNDLINANWHFNLVPSFIWNEEDIRYKGSTPYVIANRNAQTPRFTIKDQHGNVVGTEDYNYSYRENTIAGTGYLFVTFINGYEGSLREAFKIYLPATEKTYVENVGDGIKVTWDPVEGAAGYVIYRRAWSSTTNGWTTFERWNNTTELNWTDTKVYAGTRYQYGVKAYFAQRVDPVSGATIGGNVGDNFNLGEVGPLKTTVRITTRVLNSVTAGKKQMTVNWTPSKNFTGYQIKYATDANFTKNVVAIKITDPKAAQTVIKNLKSGTTYYVTIRSYHEFNGMTYYGEWSNVLSCKVK